MFEPHGVELPHLAPQVLQGQATLRLPELAGCQLLLQAGDVALGDVLALGLTLLDRYSCEDKERRLGLKSV